ncbi:hypothetical protein NECAME_07062 [Necator americanus]|uniref:Uncharacterized protein n=1 Tax=Necator americanus TaxID=51031 RepID=W2TPM5_NECAM|nr:hypothetical protein NECAME_07062 [Necator americanus]ETN84035.1 hypothetical protein NECAME_07062 [Necator americanus]
MPSLSDIATLLPLLIMGIVAIFVFTCSVSRIFDNGKCYVERNELRKMMRAYEFVTNTPVKLDEHREYLVDDVALVRSSPPLSPRMKGVLGTVLKVFPLNPKVFVQFT